MNKFFLLVNVVYFLTIAPAMAQEPIKLVIKDFQISEPLTQILSIRVLSQQFKKIGKTHSQKYQIVPSRTEIQEMLKSGIEIPAEILRGLVPNGILTPHVTLHQQQLMLVAQLLDLRTFQASEYQVAIADCIVTQESLCLLWQQLAPNQDFTSEKCSSYRTTQNLARTQMEYARQLGLHCKDNRRWDCDSRKGDTQCPGMLNGSSQVCFSPKIIKDNVPFKSGTCLFGVFLEILEFPGYYKPESPVETRIQKARRKPTCLNLSRAVNHISEIHSRVQCNKR